MNTKQSAASIIAKRLSARGYLALAHSVAASCHVTFEDMVSRSRKKSHAAARQALWFALYSDGRLSYPELGEIFEVDNSTICYAIKKCSARAIANPKSDSDIAVSESEVA
jgi:chromosomal replication initiation ATPase DnaA